MMLLYFFLVAALAAGLLIAWRVAHTKSIKRRYSSASVRLSIAVANGVAVVTLPAYYQPEDLGELWTFLQGEEAPTTRAHVHSLVYDCSHWVGANVLGLEMFMWQAEPTWQGDTSFCQR